MARYGALRRSSTKIWSALKRGGYSVRTRRIKVNVDIYRNFFRTGSKYTGKTTAGYCADAHVALAGHGALRNTWGGSSNRSYVTDVCAKTPTAAMKKALTQLTRKIK
jgi:hypothetical protein